MKQRLFGLIGYPLSHSFSKGYFTTKFEQEQIPNCQYENFPIETIAAFPDLIQSQPDLVGLNVTIPYKQVVMPYLDELDEGAAAIGAVNTIKVVDGQLKGYNTDVIGFSESLKELLGEKASTPLSALVLGTGGAAKAVFFALQQMGISYKTISRSKEKGDLTYEEVTADVLRQHRLIVNTTPLGMSPKVKTLPELPYIALTNQHFLYDLVYNPETTAFLQKGKDRGASVRNGLQMLHLQAEAAWSIWNS